MYVYLITNKINNKKYVGITNNYKKRWGNECSYPSDPKRRQAIQEAIHKYGKENFNFEILYKGLSIEDAVSKEYDLIREYHTWIGDPECQGYNIDRGGELNPTSNPQYGEQNGRAKITDEEAQYILDNRDKPLYVLYDEFSDKISYSEFKEIYNNKKFKHLSTKTQIYPYNMEFSCQFTSSKLDYDDVVQLRLRYQNHEYWRDVYEDYKDIYEDPWTFWNVYNGKRYSLVMPEVFTEENKHYHSSIIRSGELNGRSKLKKEDVLKIRRLHDEGISNKELYAMYPQVTPTSIRDIINFKTWKNVL